MYRTTRSISTCCHKQQEHHTENPALHPSIRAKASMTCHGAMHVAGHGQETNSRYYFPVYLALFSQAQIPMSNCSSIYIIHITKKLKEGTTYTSKHHKLRKIAELELATHCSDTTIKPAVCPGLCKHMCMGFCMRGLGWLCFSNTWLTKAFSL